jgi:gliotoxin/aspirochlorine/mycotoxins biosynthesis cytochrome P450 monooxygenase
VIDVRRLNTNPDIWGPDAEEFNPERFIGRAPSSYRFGLVRWGISSGKCMGKNMADPLLKLVTMAVVERYVLHPTTRTAGGGKSGSHAVAVNDKIEFRKI